MGIAGKRHLRALGALVFVGVVVVACGGPLAATPWAPLGCPRSPTHADARGAGAFPLKLRTLNTVGDAWEAIDVCIFVDGRVVRQHSVTDAISTIASRQPLDTTIVVARGSGHTISVGILYRGQRGAIDGTQFQLASTQSIEPERLGESPTLTAKIVSQGDDFTPVAMRFRGEWSVESAPAIPKSMRDAGPASSDAAAEPSTR